MLCACTLYQENVIHTCIHFHCLLKAGAVVDTQSPIPILSYRTHSKLSSLMLIELHQAIHLIHLVSLSGYCMIISTGFFMACPILRNLTLYNIEWKNKEGVRKKLWVKAETNGLLHV